VALFALFVVLTVIIVLATVVVLAISGSVTSILSIRVTVQSLLLFAAVRFLLSFGTVSLVRHRRHSGNSPDGKNGLGPANPARLSARTARVPVLDIIQPSLL
jgi:hypothetical protein